MIGNILAYLFGTQRSAEKTISTVSNGLDKLVYTDEEKANDAAVERAEARRMLIRWAESTGGQSVTRRFLAISLTMLWGSIYGAKLVLNALAPWMPDQVTVDRMMQSAQSLEVSAHEMNGAMMLILGFYFAAPHIDKIIDPFISKFGGDKKQSK